jgi:hypothetical protein
LEKHGSGEEEVGGLCFGESLALTEKVEDLGNEVAAFARIDRALVEDSLLLEHRTFVHSHEGIVGWWRHKRSDN